MLSLPWCGQLGVLNRNGDYASCVYRQGTIRTVLTERERERVLYWQPTGPNPLHHRDDFVRPALRHGSLHSLLQVAFYLPNFLDHSDKYFDSLECSLHSGESAASLARINFGLDSKVCSGVPERFRPRQMSRVGTSQSNSGTSVNFR